MQTNPILCFFKALLLIVSGRVTWIKPDQGRLLEMEDDLKFRVFRHVKVSAGQKAEPEALFMVRFLPRGMTVKQNIRFSRLPMLVLIGFGGFREKYWCVNDETGLCQGLYTWQTLADAEAYSKSIAMRFMAGRSDPASIHFEIKPIAR